MDLAAAAAVPPQGCTALSGILCGPDGAPDGRSLIDPASSGLNNYTIFGESVRCTGLAANVCPVAGQRHGPGLSVSGELCACSVRANCYYWFGPCGASIRVVEHRIGNVLFTFGVKRTLQ